MSIRGYWQAVTIAWIIALAPQGPANRGSATIEGRVVSAEAPEVPLGGVVVTIAAANLPRPSSVVTQADGSFRFTGLTAGRFMISSATPARLTMAFGASRPGRLGSALNVRSGEAIRDITLRLPKGSVISGTVRDSSGAPLPNLSITAVRIIGSKVQASPRVISDDRGRYRIFGLFPGEYLVAATFSEPYLGELQVPSGEEIDQKLAALQSGAAPGAVAPPRQSRSEATVVAAAPVFFPGTASQSEAGRISIGLAEERVADFRVIPSRSTRVDGEVRMSDGLPLPAITLVLEPDGPVLPQSVLMRPVLSTRPSPTDGRFAFTGVPVGRYVLAARTTDAGSSGVRFGFMRLTVTESAVDGVSLTLRPAPRFSGVVTSAGLPIPKGARVVLRLVPLGASLRLPASMRPGNLYASAVGPDGRFNVSGIAPGSYAVSLTGADPVFVESVTVDGQDVVDTALEITGDKARLEAVVALSASGAELFGRLEGANGNPAPDFFVVLCPIDPLLRQPGGRRIRSTRPATDGAFRLSGLPPGDYAVAAVTDVQDEDLENRDFLDQLVSAGVKITLGASEQKALDFRVR